MHLVSLCDAMFVCLHMVSLRQFLMVRELLLCCSFPVAGRVMSPAIQTTHRLTLAAILWSLGLDGCNDWFLGPMCPLFFVDWMEHCDGWMGIWRGQLWHHCHCQAFAYHTDCLVHHTDDTSCWQCVNVVMLLHEYTIDDKLCRGFHRCCQHRWEQLHQHYWDARAAFMWRSLGRFRIWQTTCQHPYNVSISSKIGLILKPPVQRKTSFNTHTQENCMDSSNTFSFAIHFIARQTQSFFPKIGTQWLERSSLQPVHSFFNEQHWGRQGFRRWRNSVLCKGVNTTSS